MSCMCSLEQHPTLLRAQWIHTNKSCTQSTPHPLSPLPESKAKQSCAELLYDPQSIRGCNGTWLYKIASFNKQVALHLMTLPIMASSNKWLVVWQLWQLDHFQIKSSKMMKSCNMHLGNLNSRWIWWKRLSRDYSKISGLLLANWFAIQTKTVILNPTQMWSLFAQGRANKQYYMV